MSKGMSKDKALILIAVAVAIWFFWKANAVANTTANTGDPVT